MTRFNAYVCSPLQDCKHKQSRSPSNKGYKHYQPAQVHRSLITDDVPMNTMLYLYSNWHLQALPCHVHFFPKPIEQHGFQGWSQHSASPTVTPGCIGNFFFSFYRAIVPAHLDFWILHWWFLVHAWLSSTCSHIISMAGHKLKKSLIRSEMHIHRCTQ